jgi:hypothetical protein
MGIRSGYDDSDFLKFQALSDDVCILGSVLRIDDPKLIRCAILVWLIDGLDDSPDSVFVVWIFGKVAVEKSDSHLIAFLGCPVVNEIMDLLAIHELNVVNVPVVLGLYRHILGLTG